MGKRAIRREGKTKRGNAPAAQTGSNTHAERGSGGKAARDAAPSKGRGYKRSKVKEEGRPSQIGGGGRERVDPKGGSAGRAGKCG